VVVLSRRLCGEQQQQSHNQMHHADITPILRFCFGAPLRATAKARPTASQIISTPTSTMRVMWF